MIPIGHQIREIRIKQGISQSELARRIGYTRNHLNEIEGGRKDPSIKCFSCILDELGMTIKIISKPRKNKPDGTDDDETENKE